MSQLTDYAVSLIMEDRLDEAQEFLLAESIESEIIQAIGETSQLDYLLKFEKFLDERDLYMYRGWEQGEILTAPKIEKFWVTVDLRVPANTELKGALRCCSDDEAQNTVKYHKLEDETFFVRFKVLRRILDKIEMQAKDRAEDIADQQSEV